MAKFELEAGEVMLKQGWGTSLQGGKVKFLVTPRYYLTDKRFLTYDMGKWVPFWNGLGVLLRLLIKGQPVELALPGLKLSRGKYAANKDILLLSDTSGRQVLLAGFKRWTKLFQEACNGRLAQTGEEEWLVH